MSNADSLLQQPIGVLGLGIMGAPMARNLMRKGHCVVVYNRSREKAQLLAAEGAAIADTPAELARQCGVICVMLTDPEAVWAVSNGPDGLLSVDGAGKVLLQHSTLDIASTVELAERFTATGYRFLDAPVTGSKRQVEAAQLVFEIGGDPALLDEVRSVLLTMGSHIVHAGEVGAGTALKLSMNMIVAQITAGLCEASAFAARHGVDPAHIFEVLSNSALNAPYFAIKRDPVLTRSYPPAFSLKNMLKDVRFMNRAAGAKQMELPVTQAVQVLLEKGAAAGFEEHDLTAMLEVLLGDAAAA